MRRRLNRLRVSEVDRNDLAAGRNNHPGTPVGKFSKIFDFTFAKGGSRTHMRISDIHHLFPVKGIAQFDKVGHG
ncbi:MAG: hypothetical protein H6Q48_4138 [Deltaproteobacteria bacterium]|nr:hypothetical protein [Deltaproteobacteria bacterium]